MATPKPTPTSAACPPRQPRAAASVSRHDTCCAACASASGRKLLREICRLDDSLDFLPKRTELTELARIAASRRWWLVSGQRFVKSHDAWRGWFITDLLRTVTRWLLSSCPSFCLDLSLFAYFTDGPLGAAAGGPSSRCTATSGAISVYPSERSRSRSALTRSRAASAAAFDGGGGRAAIDVRDVVARRTSALASGALTSAPDAESSRASLATRRGRMSRRGGDRHGSALRFFFFFFFESPSKASSTRTGRAGGGESASSSVVVKSISDTSMPSMPFMPSVVSLASLASTERARHRGARVRVPAPSAFGAPAARS